ncbi:dihydroneopterin aldolase [Litorivicinus lipolyticus]|uniref:7,8-dihydroneopterin aldolase n=1 Tax=Litorivicinus lipolyticus TaxID=418701 RepID=A0A5Q2QD98_9GAMM|nr:dihydroneopterin aldolase [Litorivicinus lipolyticus]QGG81114.1 dihydroneopterin aldolase [Litorivicinus lipolyticus]
MSDSVFVTGLVCETIVGVYDFERVAPRQLLIDLDMDWDNRPAGASDNLELALNYDAVSQRVRALVSSMQPLLIETIAEAVAQDLLQTFGLSRLTLTLHKPGAVAGTTSLGVRITRQQAH